jgi:rare lipoprotein A
MRAVLTTRIWLAGFSLIACAGPMAAQDSKTFTGIASYYAKNYSGKTASGEKYDQTKFTAAHRTLPFGTRVVVTDVKTKRSVTVRVNDRGPFIKGRVIDLSYAAAAEMRMHARGLAKVTAVVE